MYYMCKNHGLQAALHARDANTWKHLKTWISGAIALAFLMGITWIFGFLYIGNLETVIFAYVFTFLNSFQGVFILVLVCLRNDKVCSVNSGSFHIVSRIGILEKRAYIISCVDLRKNV